ncbi:MAG: creatininase family protein [Chloroflexota bacterium]
MADVLRYVDLALPDLAGLDRERTVFLWAVSPIEIHGPHLPVGTDVFVAEELQRRYISELAGRHPAITPVVLPSLHAGSDALPVKGSLSVPAPALESILVAYAKGLAAQGFRYLLLSDNHGGPRHAMAIEAASRTAWRRWRFYLINPFNTLFRRMVECDAELLRETGLGPTTCGDDPDSHAGTNETSLMMVAAPDKIRAGAEHVPPSQPAPLKGGAKTVAGLAALVRVLGGKRFSRDLEHLARTLNWVSDPNMKPYMGDPGKASRDAGERMLNAHLNLAMSLLDRALAGEPVQTDPLLWTLRAMRRLPE